MWKGKGCTVREEDEGIGGGTVVQVEVSWGKLDMVRLPMAKQAISNLRVPALLQQMLADHRMTLQEATFVVS